MARAKEIPSRFWERLSRLVPPDRHEAIRESFEGPRGGSFRVNTLLTTVGAVLGEVHDAGIEVAPIGFCPEGFLVGSADRERLASLEATRDSRIWLQNASSMVPVVALAPQPGEIVLDLAAAPGSKTLQLAAAMRSEGELAAVEVVKPRFFRLRRNLDAAGASFVRTYLQDGTRAWRYRPDHFDRVLIDAPCSTEGRFRVGEPETFRYWSPAKIRAMAAKQAALLDSALRCVRPGGVVVYSTCSFGPEENEAVVSAQLARHDVDVEPIGFDVPGAAPGMTAWEGESFDERLRHAVRILPDGTYEGFFVCRLRRLE